MKIFKYESSIYRDKKVKVQWMPVSKAGKTGGETEIDREGEIESILLSEKK